MPDALCPRPITRLALFVLALTAATARGEGGADDVEQAPPFDQFLVLPLRVHILSSDRLPDVDCRLKEGDVTRIIGKVNGIWNRAGVHWGLESLVREPAARQGAFRLAREIDGAGNLALYRMLLPEASRGFEGLHVYYLHEFPVNGVWLGGGTALVQETARLRPVEGGIDEPVPRVTAHELGHALGLSHRQDRTNLLASGTTGTRLNRREVETARAAARATKGVRTVAGLKAEASDAEAAGDHEGALRRWTWLGEIPGGGDDAREAVARLKRGAKTKPPGAGGDTP